MLPVILVKAKPLTVTFVALATWALSYALPVLERVAVVSPDTSPTNEYVGVNPIGAVVVASYTFVTPEFVKEADNDFGVIVAETFALLFTL